MDVRNDSPGGAAGVGARAVAALWLALLASPVHAAGAAAEEGCLDCHEDAEETFEVGDGTEITVGIDVEAWTGSVHGKELACRDCHRTISEHPHPEVAARSVRDYTLQQAKTCQHCHYAYYTRMLDGIHFELQEAGDGRTPVCVDCHGSHDVRAPGEPRLDVSARCGRCHEEIRASYEASVHGRSLAIDPRADAPVCTDCHGAHDIADPRTLAFKSASYQICARCHGDPVRMARHDLNPDVVTTYLDDFHGASNRLYAAGAGTPTEPIATCTDCHGIHDIARFRDRGSQLASVRAKVATVCRKCHQEASIAFGDAWLSHYRPAPDSAPLVWLVKLAYWIMIPLIMLGLILHILLHLWRVRFVRRS